MRKGWTSYKPDLKTRNADMNWTFLKMLSSNICMGAFYTHTPFSRRSAWHMTKWQANMVPPTSAEITEQPTKQKIFQYDGELGGHGSCKSATGCACGVDNRNLAFTTMRPALRIEDC